MCWVKTKKKKFLVEQLSHTKYDRQLRGNNDRPVRHRPSRRARRSRLEKQRVHMQRYLVPSFGVIVWSLEALQKLLRDRTITVSF